jgi:tRNA dimethylallyltransferase
LQAVSDSKQPLVICIVGPTAAGKTDIAVDLVRRFPCEIVSVDSAMVYRHMDIGSAKPDTATLEAAPHHLIDIRNPWESYSAGQFCADARELIDDIHARSRIPLLVGGTSLYFHALQFGLAPLPSGDADARAEIDRRAEAQGWPALHAELADLDPAAAARIRPTDRQRLQRALEVIALTGSPLSELQRVDGDVPAVDFLRIALAPHDRAELHRRIEARFQAMLAAGFIEEVERLQAMPEMNANSPAMRAVGYRQLWSYLDGALTKEEAVHSAIVATRRLAKRQLTWLRGEPGDAQFDCQRPDAGSLVTEAVRIRLAAADV